MFELLFFFWFLYDFSRFLYQFSPFLHQFSPFLYQFSPFLYQFSLFYGSISTIFCILTIINPYFFIMKKPPYSEELSALRFANEILLQQAGELRRGSAAVGGSGITSGSGWVAVVPLDRGDQCGHFGTR
jgi:hypothetical protein